MNNLHLSNFDIHLDSRGVLSAILNVANQPVNVFNESVLHDLDELILAVNEDHSVTAVVFRSGKENGFLAGADLHGIEALSNSDQARESCQAGQDLFHRLESLRVPTVAVINGVCLGGGLEFVLACRFRIVVDNPRTKLGLPEVELGLLPGWGGTQRLPRQIGLSAALPMLLTGKKVGAKEAYQIGLADAVCPLNEIDSVINRLLTVNSAKESGSVARQRGHFHPWTWFADQTSMGNWLMLRVARHRIAERIQEYPALTSILKAVSAGLHNRHQTAGTHFASLKEDGFAIEREEFSGLISTETHHNLLGLFFQRELARKAETWVGEMPKPRRVKKIGVIGGGIMGSGIAHWASLQGFEVVLKEVNESLLNLGVSRVRELFDESVNKGAVSAADAERKFQAVTATTSWEAFEEIDLVIEAVTERMDVKHAVFRDLEQHCPPEAILVSNTSALSIREIGEAIHDSARVLGLHFFNPVHRMQLVEVVRTERSHPEDIALLVDFVKSLNKVPLVTEDRPGFVVNRILFPYFDEAVRLYSEGVRADVIDRELKRFGMPMGPLELLDQVGIDVAAHVADSLSGLSSEPSPTGNLLREMAAKGNIGRKSGQGFYQYTRGGKHRGRAVASSITNNSVARDDIRDRIVMRLINEAARCLQDGVVPEPWMIDLGMVLGTGFAPFLGGPLRLCEREGYGEVVAKLDYFQKAVGSRFAPAQWLIDQIGHHTDQQAEHHTT